MNLENRIRVGYKCVYMLILSAYKQFSVAESRKSDANNEAEEVCETTDDIHQLFMYLKKELQHNQNVIREMTQSCNISSVNLYVGAKEVNTITHTSTCKIDTTASHASYITTYTNIHIPSQVHTY